MPCHQEDTSNPFSLMIQKSVSCVVVVPVSVNCEGRDVLSIANRGFETKMMPSYGRLINLSVNHVAIVSLPVLQVR